MKISEELLTRYALGECTAEEKAFVERWLEASEEPETTSYQAEFKPLKKRLWDRLKSETIQSNRRRIKISPVFRYIAAACLLGGILGIGMLKTTQLLSVERTFENQEGSVGKMVLSDGMAVSLMPETRVEWIGNPFQAYSVKVCGNTILRNVSRRETDIQLSSSCSGRTKTSKSLTLRKDESYYVLASGGAANQLLIMDKGEIEMLHPAHRARVNAVFQYESTLKI